MADARPLVVLGGPTIPTRSRCSKRGRGRDASLAARREARGARESRRVVAPRRTRV